jgi:hypothetical protein
LLRSVLHISLGWAGSEDRPSHASRLAAFAREGTEVHLFHDLDEVAIVELVDERIVGRPRWWRGHGVSYRVPTELGDE